MQTGILSITPGKTSRSSRWDSGSSLGRLTVKKELGVNLPPYMMPGKTARMDFLPMNKNGKIDRGALLSMAVPDFSCGADSHDKGRV